MIIKKLSLIFVILLLSPLFVFADGALIKPLPDGTWDWVDQNTQEAFISYQNGIQKLIIGVDIQKEFSEAVWIIPIPVKPEEVKIDIVSSLPRFYGWEVTKRAQWSLRDPAFFSIYPTIIPILMVPLGEVGTRAGIGEKVEGRDISVVTRLEKAGMVAEVLTAKTDQALYDYLSGKGLKIERGAISVFNQYIGKEYVFVVSWIEELIRGERGIYITFPTSKIYYPLIPTSAYGEKEIPVTIRILDYVKPKIYSEIKPYIKAEYYTKVEEHVRDASRVAHCILELRQMSLMVEIFEIYPYPISLEELKSVNKEIDLTLKNIEKYCPSPPLYQLSSDGKEYTLSVFLGDGKEYFISSFPSPPAGEREVPPPLELKDFYDNQEVWKGNSRYTKITINAPSEKFTQDLWMEPQTPLRVLFLSGISEIAVKYPRQTCLFFVVLLSFLIGGISGKICFGKFKKYALIGLFNLATILSLILIMILVKKEEGSKFTKPVFIGMFFCIYSVFSILLGLAF